MKTSASIANIAPALIRARAKFPAIVRTKRAEIKGDKGSYSFMYAPLEEILHALCPVLQSEDLMLMQGVEGFSLETTILHSSGEFITHSMELPHAYPSPRAYGSELTFRRRYSVTAVLGIASEEDDDGQQAETDLKRAAKPRKQGHIPASDAKAEAWDRLADVDGEHKFLMDMATNLVAMLDEGGRDDDAYAYFRQNFGNMDADEQLGVQFAMDQVFTKAHHKAMKEAGERFRMAEGAQRRAADKQRRGASPEERAAA